MVAAVAGACSVKVAAAKGNGMAGRRKGVVAGSGGKGGAKEGRVWKGRKARKEGEGRRQVGKARRKAVKVGGRTVVVLIIILHY